MLAIADYWMGRDVPHASELSPAISDNAIELLGRVNLLLSWALPEGVGHGGVASGWRPRSINDATANAAMASKHLTGRAIDLRDDANRSLARWCLRNQDALAEVGLWMEDPQWTPAWIHLQSVPPGSGRRVYVPTTRPALIAKLPEQDKRNFA
jgi:hypothetical protein